MGMSAFLATLLGSLGAFSVVFIAFPGRSFLKYFLVLPLALPVYVMAFVQIGFWGFWVRSFWGTVMVMSLALYPYAYLLMRTAFQQLNGRAVEVLQSLGYSPLQAIIKLSRTAVLPFLLSCLLVIALEVMADFGAVSILNFKTLSVAVYQAWFGLFSMALALKFAAVLLGLAVMGILIRSFVLGRKQYAFSHLSIQQSIRFESIWAKLFGAGLCWGIFIFAFLIPVGQLGVWGRGTVIDWLGMVGLIRNSSALALSGALICSAVAFAWGGVQYLNKKRGLSIGTVILQSGYGIPGAVLALGVFLVFQKVMPILVGTVFVMVVGYCIRFFAVGYSGIESGFKQVSTHLGEVSASLGFNRFKTLLKLFLPMMKGSVGVSVCLVFVEIMKEMPMTLMTRPFGWDGLSIRIFELTSEGLWAQAAIPSLILLGVGFIPVMILVRGDRIR